MRVLKVLLGVMVVACLVGMWSQRQFVIDAYANEGRSGADVRLDGIDLDVALSPLEPSPYVVEPAPDTRSVPVVLAFADSEEAEPESAPDADDDRAGGDGDDGESEAVAVEPPPPAEPIPPPPLYGGDAVLSGVVRSPDGPVPFATIRLERHTLEGFAATDVTADRSGAWSSHRLLGGRYRVRAWAANESLAMMESQVFFLNKDERRSVELTLGEIDPDPRLRLTDAGGIYVGLSGTVAVSVTVQTIDADGRIVTTGLPGAIVTLAPTGTVTTPTPIVVADHDGVARFSLHCQALGPSSAVVQHREDVVSFGLPDCIPIPPPPTTTTTVPSAAGGDGPSEPSEAAPSATSTPPTTGAAGG